MGATPWGAIVMAVKSIYDKNTKKMHQRANELQATALNSLKDREETKQNATKIAKENQINNPIAEYQNYLRDNGYSEEAINGVPQGLNSGYPEIQQWQEQYNQGAGKNNPINFPKTEEEINLAKQGQFNSPVVDGGGVSEKSSILEKLADGISDFTTGFNENKNNAFLPSNLTDNKFSNGENKGFMGRMGEAFGSARRAMDKPLVQGLLAGGASYLGGHGPLTSLENGYNYARNKAMSDVYAQALKNEGFDVPTEVFNSYNANDFGALIQPKYKDQELEIKKLEKDIMNDYRNAQIENQKYRNETDRMYKEHQIKNGGNSGKKDITQQKGWNEALSGYISRKYDPRYSDKLDLLRAKFISEYGVDPDKYLKD